MISIKINRLILDTSNKATFVLLTRVDQRCSAITYSVCFDISMRVLSSSSGKSWKIQLISDPSVKYAYR